MPSYCGMCLIAIDGTDAALENSAELKQTFGCSGTKKNAATALCSIAYGPLDHVIYDCRIDFIRLLLQPDKTIRDAMLQRIVDAISERPVSVVPNRSPSRGAPRKKRFYMSKKSVL